MVEVNKKHRVDGRRFEVKEYPKSGKTRRFKLGAGLVTKLNTHITENQLRPGDLLFALRQDAEQPIPEIPDPDTLGRTEPNAKGRTYKHGTMTGYSLGKCKCAYCRGAYARYRAERRAAGKDDPRTKRLRETDGHIPREWWRTQIWKPALHAAGIPTNIRFHDLRHSHASWLLAGGADLQVVKERLGHGSLRTTEIPPHPPRRRRNRPRRLHQDPQPRQAAKRPGECGMNPKTRRAAMHAIAAIAILASLNALAHSYAGLYQWAIHHRITGWLAATWPAEIDVFLLIGELALYVAYLDAWTTRHKIWPWATALLGLAVSVASNIGHIPAAPDDASVPTPDRLTAATSPLAAFAGLAVALLVLKQTRSSPTHPSSQPETVRDANAVPDTGPPTFRFPPVLQTIPMHFRTNGHGMTTRVSSYVSLPAGGLQLAGEPPIVQDAREVCTEYKRRGTRLTRRQLASELRARGHTLANGRLRELAKAIDLP